jgi:3'(2'), 5'-bisphosphate nucleotidase
MSLTDQQLAAQLAASAGRLLLCTRDSGLLDGRDLGAAGDAISQQLLSRALGVARPGDAVLSEEARDDATRLGSERVWIIDPLDGTREFGEGRQDWGVHVALAIRGRTMAAAVALPALDIVLDSSSVTSPPGGVNVPLRVAVSRTRPPAEATILQRKLGAELVPMGSAGYKVSAVVRGEVDAYVHAGGQYEWDSAAPIGVALAAGLHASRIDGSPLTYNNPDPSLPDLVVCRPELADRILGAIAAGAPGNAASPDA